jgi:hypothetical protein
MHAANTLSGTGAVLSSVCRPLSRAASNAKHLSADELDAQWLIARRHAIAPMLIEQWRIDSQPLSLSQQIDVDSEIKTCAQRAALMSMFGRAVLDALSSSAVPCLIYKGLPLSKHVFGRHDARLTGDIDLLVSEGDLPRTAEVLKALGFECVVDVKWLSAPGFVRDFYEVEFRSKNPGMEIDVHWQLAPRWIAHPRRCHELIAQPVTISISGTDWPWLDAADVWFVQCVELIKSEWVEFKSIVSFALAWDVVIADKMTDKAKFLAGLFSPQQRTCLRYLLRDWLDREVWADNGADEKRQMRDGASLAARIGHILFADNPSILSKINRRRVECSKYLHHESSAAAVLFDRLTTPHYDDLLHAKPGCNRTALTIEKSKRMLRLR